MGLDMGDHYTHYCVLDQEGKVVERDRMFTGRGVFEAVFAERPAMRVVLEAGTNSPWASRAIKECGHEVIVANPRKVRAIYQSDNKTDHLDAETLGRIGRLDPKLLAPIEHRSADAQVALARVRARDALVRSRTQLINHVRGAVKSFGGRLPASSAESFPRKAAHIPKELWPALAPLIDTIGKLTTEIRKLDRTIEQCAEENYPETKKLRKVNGVGPLTSMAFVLTIDDPRRFEESRDVGAYLGLRPRHDQSGDTRKQLRITKAGDTYLRRLLVGSAQYILGPFGQDCELRRWGLELTKRGGKNAKKRATVAVARKLAVLLHKLLVSDVPYDPEYNSKRKKSKAPSRPSKLAVARPARRRIDKTTLQDAPGARLTT
jgi:transposase